MRKKVVPGERKGLNYYPETDRIFKGSEVQQAVPSSPSGKDRL
jgi:hypothetical protein